MKANVPHALLFVGIFWAVFFLNLLIGYRLNLLGIYPRRWFGMPGIIISPFLHANFTHLFFNSIPLLVLSDFVLSVQAVHFAAITSVIICGSGILLWLFGRRGIHIGASALVMGYLGYLLAHAYQQPSVSSILLALVCVYYFGSLLLGLFPSEEKISWEGHLFGFLIGLATAWLY